MVKSTNDKQADYMITTAAIEYGVSPRLIRTLLISDEDYSELGKGEISQQILNMHVKLWKDGGCKDCVKHRD